MQQIAVDFSDAFGGELAPLWKTFISNVASNLEENLQKNKMEHWIGGFELGLKALKETHNLKLGDRTIVDTLEAGQEYITNTLKNNQPVDLV